MWQKIDIDVHKERTADGVVQEKQRTKVDSSGVDAVADESSSLLGSCANTSSPNTQNGYTPVSKEATPGRKNMRFWKRQKEVDDDDVVAVAVAVQEEEQGEKEVFSSDLGVATAAVTSTTTYHHRRSNFFSHWQHLLWPLEILMISMLLIILLECILNTEHFWKIVMMLRGTTEAATASSTPIQETNTTVSTIGG